MHVPPVVRLDLADPHGELARRHLIAAFRGRVRIVADDSSSERAGARLVPITDLSPAEQKEPVVAVGDAELPAIVELMANRPWLNHVVSPRFFEQDAWGTSFVAALWKMLMTPARPMVPFGRGFRGRQAKVWDSARRGKRIDAIGEHAEQAGAARQAIERIQVIAEELLSNALYDAPTEANKTVADRTQRVVLPRDSACHLTYGATKQTFFLRVRDRYGSLKRDRLLSVLTRCGREGDVAIDASRGGAGLGMWRIFSMASLVAVHVRPHASTEFLVGVDIQRGRRAVRGRAVHLFFGERSNEHEREEREVRS